jgi:hypothetical protein
MRFIIFAIFCLSAKERTDLKNFSEEDLLFKRCQSIKGLEEYEEKMRQEIIIEHSFGSGDGNDNNFRSARGDMAG